ncbi:MAG TPA: (2Fe-2S)-binding protein, partial [Thermoanaerobaculia bacterium]|nr:(2Fe-2S)-binding protein [Thermoanaerobaculia bacterium]
MAEIELLVNGTRFRFDVDPQQSLLSALRDELDLTGTKYGCGEAQCGACTVLIDGQPARSCVTNAASAAGHAITTIEGIAPDGALHPVQKAFLDAEAMQCGYCTSGMIVEGVALLRRRPDAGQGEIAEAMEGHV